MILLDTCTLLWLVKGQGLPPAIAARIENPENGVFVSAVSALEIGLKVAKGRLQLPMPLNTWWAAVVEQHGLGEVPIEAEIAIAATELPAVHGDPADRILIATARHLGATLLTPDPLIRAYPQVRVAWG